MIRNILIIVTMCAFTGAAMADSAAATDKSKAAEDRWLTLSYGDVDMDFEDSDADASGWRLNLSYEKGKKGGNLLHGFVVGYIESTADAVVEGQTSSFEIKSLPIYYAPKYLFGKKAFKGFVKGAIGLQFSDFQRTGSLGNNIDTSDSGLYLGASLGAMFMFTEKFFANVEYEWAYLSNSYYRDDAVQSAMIGIGMKF